MKQDAADHLQKSGADGLRNRLDQDIGKAKGGNSQAAGAQNGAGQQQRPGAAAQTSPPPGAQPGPQPQPGQQPPPPRGVGPQPGPQPGPQSPGPQPQTPPPGAGPQPQQGPSPQPQPQPQPATAASSLGEWDAGDEPGTIPPRQWLLGNQFCRGFISSIVAAGGAGKSALRLLQFISMALGRPLCGQHIFRRSRVLVISLEDDRDELQRRIRAVLDHYRIDRKELKGWLFCASPKLAKLAEMKRGKRVIGPLEQEIRDAIKRRKPDLISLDPFIKTHGLEENDSGDMDFVCDLIARIAIKFNIAVDSPHHVHKGQMTPGDADSGRGSSGIRDAGRLVYTLVPMSEAEAKIFDIDLENRATYVRLDPAKVNIAARSGKAEWFHIIGQPIGNATTEYPNGDTIQVVEPWSPPDAWKGTSPVVLNAILDDIAAGLPNGQRYSNAPAAAKRTVWPVVQKHYPQKAEGECRTIIHAWLKSGLLYADQYDDPVDYKKRSGLYVDDAKRP
jgi:hypothetical protein